MARVTKNMGGYAAASSVQAGLTLQGTIDYIVASAYKGFKFKEGTQAARFDLLDGERVLEADELTQAGKSYEIVKSEKRPCKRRAVGLPKTGEILCRGVSRTSFPGGFSGRSVFGGLLA